ncbi:MAG TPA: response regulator transcription factor [Spirochaetota bacterium]|nr:response regulator transcription factor [Spirochaetota bacterium]
MKKSRILIVDDHPIFRKGLGQLVNEEADMEVCGEAEDFFTAIQKLKNLKPDLAIVDITLKDTSGLELIKYITDNGINVPALVLSMHDEKIFAERALKSGAKGYIMKQEMSDNVTVAIRQLLAGKIYISEAMNERLLNNFLGRGNEAGAENSNADPARILTGRELEIFRLMGKGYKRNEISKALNLNVNTIGTYRERIKEKLDLNSSVDLLAQAILWVRNTEENEVSADNG